MTTVELNEELIIKALSIVDKGLSKGLGKPIPGKMCVEAAICYALGLPHDDNPKCVTKSLMFLKIRINDLTVWENNEERAKGLRRLAIAQLNTQGNISGDEFMNKVRDTYYKKILQNKLKSLLNILGKKDKEYVEKILSKMTINKSETIKFVRYNPYYAKHSDLRLIMNYLYYKNMSMPLNLHSLEEIKYFAEEIVQILIEMKSPGADWLWLAPLENNENSLGE